MINIMKEWCCVKTNKIFVKSQIEEIVVHDWKIKYIYNMYITLQSKANEIRINKENTFLKNVQKNKINYVAHIN